MKNDVVKSIAVLGSICLAVALLLSSVNLITDPIIKQAEESTANEAFYAVLPDASEFETVELGDNVPESVLELRRDKGGSGYAFKLNVTGTYSGKDMTLVVGIGPDGKITKLSFVEYFDSRGSADDFNNVFSGKDNTADGIAGATITSNAIKAALGDAYTVLSEYSTIEQSDEQKLASLYEKLMPAAANPVFKKHTFSSVELPAGTDTAITGAYAPSNEIGYVITAKVNDVSVAIAINAFGAAYKVYDLDGNDLTDDVTYADIKAKAEAVLEPVYKANENVDNRRIKNALKAEFGEDVANALQLNAYQLSSVSSTVSAAYNLEINGKLHYAFTANAVGYGGTIKVLYIMDADGNIALYKTTSQSESKGYGAAIAEGGYADGITDKNIDALSDDAVLISGATVTSEAVKMAKNDIKAAFNTVKGGQ